MDVPTTQADIIAILVDGTGQDGNQQPTKATNADKRMQKSDSFRSRAKVIVYIPGLGSSQENPLSDTVSQATGYDVDALITQVCFIIKENYVTGDKIYLVGFSRGAYCVKIAAWIVVRAGTMLRETLGCADSDIGCKKYWEAEELGTAENAGQNVCIEWLVLWDTVGAVFASSWMDELNQIPLASSPLNVSHTLHAVAIHENRPMFQVILVEDNGVTGSTEVWFTGAYSDVGGGASNSLNLQNASLIWDIGQIPEFSGFNTEDLLYPELDTVTPSNALEDTGSVLLKLVSAKTRVASGQLKSTSRLHESEVICPQVNTPDGLVTKDQLRALGWNEDLFTVRFNDFEASKLSKSSASLRRSTTGIPNTGRPVETQQHNQP
ncbi:choline transport protein [Ceratobasidium sp. AG-Ba]|nr:choline transport protein [Ceratobasidium sp. AG-Ba]